MRIFLALLLSICVAAAGPRGSLDPRTAAYADRVYDGSGVAPTMLGRAQVAAFVQNYVIIGLWSNMVCWPLRSFQNAGTGTVAYSLGGLSGGPYNGTLVNGPTWGEDGMTFVNASGKYITTGITLSYNAQFMLFSCATRTSNESGNRIFGTPGSANTPFFYRTAGSTAVGAFNGTSYSTFTTPANSSINFVSMRYSDTQLIGTPNGSAPTATGYTPVAVTQDISIGAGQTAGVNYWTGPIAVAGYFVGSSSDIAMSALYALYKSTLGQGLGLP